MKLGLLTWEEAMQNAIEWDERSSRRKKKKATIVKLEQERALPPWMQDRSLLPKRPPGGRP